MELMRLPNVIPAGEFPYCLTFGRCIPENGLVLYYWRNKTIERPFSRSKIFTEAQLLQAVIECQQWVESVGGKLIAPYPEGWNQTDNTEIHHS